MVKASHLRAVAPGEKQPVRSITEAASTGTTRDVLVAMRSRIAKAVEDESTPARDLAALTKRLMEVVRDIEAIDARAEEDAARVSEAEDERFDASAI